MFFVQEGFTYRNFLMDMIAVFALNRRAINCATSLGLVSQTRLPNLISLKSRVQSPMTSSVGFALS